EMSEKECTARGGWFSPRRQEAEVRCTGEEPATVFSSALEATKGSTVSGWVTITRRGDTVTVEARGTNLTPGLHALDIHDKGDCWAPNTSSAVAVLKPDVDGVAVYQAQLQEGYPAMIDSLIGRAVVVSDKADDQTGSSGQPLACGLIGAGPLAPARGP